MNKLEREQMGVMCEFIHNLYFAAGLAIPEQFNAEEETMILCNALRGIGRKEAIAALLHAEKDLQEKEKLTKLIENVSL